MTTTTQAARDLIQWYAREGRPFLADVDAQRVAQLDRETERFERLERMLGEELPICFLGTSGVGKSTLINALVAGRDVVLPAGGVGPLTAEATVVRYAAERRFGVRYHPPGKLNQLLFALERAHELDLKRRESVAPRSQDANTEVPLQDAAPVPDTAPVSARGSQVTDTIENLTRQAVHLIRGDQYAELDRGYLLDGLRECLGNARNWGTEGTPEDLKRIARVKEALQRANSNDGLFELTARDDESVFRNELLLHAAGHLAPLVRSINVDWDTDMLQSGAQLIDLPGLGVANDEFRRVTAHWIRKSRGVVLVVDRSGMSEASAELLRSSGFLNSLLHESTDSEAQNVTLMVVVVKLDATADEERTREKTIHQGRARPWAQHFEEVCGRAQGMIRAQLSTELQKIVEQGGESTREERELVIRRVLDGLQVHTVVAPEYRKLLADDEDDRPRIRTVEQSGIPALAAALEKLVQERNDRIDVRAELLARGLRERLRTTLQLIQARAESERRQRTERSEHVRQELQALATRLQLEVSNKQGEFREFLSSTMPREIEARVDRAAASAHKDITKHLRRYQSYHWGTVRAAIRRGGVYNGSKHIDLPADLAMLFDEPIAVACGKHVLSELRKRTLGIGREYVSILDELLEWARAHDDSVNPAVLEALRSELDKEMEALADVGREAIDELKAHVKVKLYPELEKKIRSHCEDFVEGGEDRGTGVRSRMLSMLGELADVAVEAARPVAERVLRDQYHLAREQILATFSKHGNPVTTAVSEIVGSSTGAVTSRARDDAARLQHGADALLAAMPGEPLQCEAAQ